MTAMDVICVTSRPMALNSAAIELIGCMVVDLEPAKDMLKEFIKKSHLSDFY